jgi:cytochrome P450
MPNFHQLCFLWPPACLPVSLSCRAINEQGIEASLSELRKGYYWADWIPILDRVPDFMAPWRAAAWQAQANVQEFWSVPFDMMANRVKNGDAPDCFVQRFLESPELDKFDDISKRAILSEILNAGSDTTATSLQWFFKAVLLFPEFAKTAREELDRVVGPDRIPGWDDKPNLPYINATVLELHRWASVAPLGILHATTEDDIYRGKLIPAGTTVVTNAAVIHHSDEYYPEARKFIPERFLASMEKNPWAVQGARRAQHYAFGVGRRECPGQHVANASLFIGISRLLWAFDIDLGSNPPPSNETGKYHSAGQRISQDKDADRTI